MKSFSEIEALLLPIVKKSARLLGYSVVKLSFVREFDEFYLKIIIDSPNGINISDCDNLSNALDPILDEVNILPDTYYLVISSHILNCNMV